MFFACACGTDYAAMRRGKDHYQDLAALQADNVPGRDYSREVYDRGSQVSVFAIHGGDIELATARLARAIAGAEYNLYIFNGWLGEDSRKLHITSTRFDDPEAVRLATSAVLGISLHGQADRGEWVCVGGANVAGGKIMADELSAAGFEAQTPCARLPGTNPKNLVNKAATGGVQLEITIRLLNRLERSQNTAAKFAQAVRSAAAKIVSAGK